MKQKPIHPGSAAWFVFCLVCAALLSIAGCATQTPDPLAGWKPLYGRAHEKFEAAVKEDYEHYIETLPRREKGFVGPIQFFEDGTGLHAIRIEIALNGDDWAHILIYDANNKKIRTTSFIYAHYRS